jgi:hypothetical protein
MQYCCGGVMDLPTLAADPGVTVKANAENATADAMAILRIVFTTLSTMPARLRRASRSIGW